MWDALVDPEAIRRYMFGTIVISDWTEGSPIVWRGEWKGKAYKDTGVILRLERGRVLRYSHFSPLSGLPDTPENHHTVTIELGEQAGRTRVWLARAAQQEAKPSEGEWGALPLCRPPHPGTQRRGGNRWWRPRRKSASL